MTSKTDKYFAEHKPFEGLGRASARSGVTLVVARAINAVVQVATMVLLARLLSPQDYGLVGVVTAMVTVAPLLVDLGTSEASLQKAHASRGEVSALFWLNIAVGGACTIIFAAISGLIASVFKEPAMAGIALASSLTFILTAMTVQHYALMRRAMDFRAIAINDTIANMLGSVIAIAMAFGSWGYWALVAKPLVTLTFTAIGAWISCPWLPGRPEFTAGVKSLVRFGLGVTGFTVSDSIVRSADRIALGYFYGPGPVGYYQNAFLLYSNVLSILTDSLHNLAVTSLSKLRGNLDDLKRSWTAALSTVSFVSAGAFAGLAVTGQDFVLLLFGEKWAETGPLLCLFAIRGIAHTTERTLGWLHVTAGRPDRWAKWGLVSAGWQIFALAAGLPFGPMGVAVSYAIVTYGLCVPALAYSGRPLGIGARDVLAAAGPQTLAALCATAIGLIVQHVFLGEFTIWARFFLSAFICMATYLIVAVGIFRVTGPLKLAFSLVRDLAHRHSPKTA